MATWRPCAHFSTREQIPTGWNAPVAPKRKANLEDDEPGEEDQAKYSWRVDGEGVVQAPREADVRRLKRKEGGLLTLYVRQ